MDAAATNDHANDVDREGYRLSAAGGPSQTSEWTSGNKDGFSVVADYGTAHDVVLPDGAEREDGGPAKVRLPLLLQLLDPARFPSPSTAKKKVRQGVVLVNGRRGKVDSLITIGRDHVTLQARTESKFKPMGEPPFHINVIYEDDVMAVVHKPPGVCTHPPKGQVVPQTQAQSMMSMRCCVPYHVKCAPPGMEGILWRPMLVHRLDKDTEGLQIVAKTKKAYIELQRQFAKRLIKKQYLALVQGCVEGDEGTVDMVVDEKEVMMMLQP
jgi:23S rRNA-/tRNA-specific pseudouridylate synthase